MSQKVACWLQRGSSSVLGPEHTITVLLWRRFSCMSSGNYDSKHSVWFVCDAAVCCHRITMRMKHFKFVYISSVNGDVISRGTEHTQIPSVNRCCRSFQQIEITCHDFIDIHHFIATLFFLSLHLIYVFY